MIRGALSLLFWLFMALSSALLFPVAVAIWALTAPFDKRRVVLHGVTCLWASLYTWLNPAWKVEIRGREHIAPHQAYVMVANHLSTLDILVLFRLFTHFKWVSKVENFRLPFIGWNMRLNRYIPLVRGKRGSVVQMMRNARETLGEGSSVMMFPEGTRSQSGRLRAFKMGAFELALKAETPLLPIVIRGSGNALPKRGFLLRGRHRIRVDILDPLPFEAFQSLSAKELTEQVRSLFADELGQAQATA
jgi:1-acyl-sn-glycerol-3-phosphate acyltransferase